MYKEKIIDHKTGKEIWRDLSKEEIAEIETAQVESLKKFAEMEAKQSIRNSALAKLAALGLTEDEIAAL